MLYSFLLMIALTSIPLIYSYSRLRSTIVNKRLFLSNDGEEMELNELKAELDLRKVDYSDCFSRRELTERLKSSREVGRADPTIVDRFNEIQGTDEIQDFSDDILNESTAADGGLPGGLPPKVMQLLAKDREIIEMLKDPKMQDIMKAVMTGGPEGLKKYLSDPSAVVLLKKLGETMTRIMQGPQ